MSTRRGEEEDYSGSGLYAGFSLDKRAGKRHKIVLQIGLTTL
jgi:hypothetical protein